MPFTAAKVAALRIEGSERRHVVMKKSSESIAILPVNLEFISEACDPSGHEDVQAPLSGPEVWEELQDAFAWANNHGQSARKQGPGVLLVTQNLDPTRPDANAQIEFTRTAIIQRRMPKPKCADLMAPKSS